MSALSGDPNSATTLPYILDSAIRGAVAARLRAGGGNAEDEWFRTLVLSGQIRYFNAYLEIGAERALPVPLSWKRNKNDAQKEKGYDLAAYSGPGKDIDDPDDLETTWPNSTLTDPDARFTATVSSSCGYEIASPKIDGRLHQQRGRQVGRPWKEELTTLYQRLHARLTIRNLAILNQSDKMDTSLIAIPAVSGSV